MNSGVSKRIGIKLLQRKWCFIHASKVHLWKKGHGVLQMVGTPHRFSQFIGTSPRLKSLSTRTGGHGFEEKTLFAQVCPEILAAASSFVSFEHFAKGFC